MVNAPQEEGMHPHGPEENWQESWVFGWRDPVANVGGHMRVGIQPNRGTSIMWCAVYAGHDRIFRLNLEGQPLVPLPAGQHGFGCASQRMFHDGEHLRVTLDEPQCRVDLVIEDYEGSLEQVDASNAGALSHAIYKAHFNLHARVRGQVVLDGVRHPVDHGVGWRDHSWGPRDWSLVLCPRPFHGTIGPDFTYHLLTVMTRDGTLTRRGHLMRDGQASAIHDFTIRTEFLEDGFTPVQAHCLVMLPDEAPLLIAPGPTSTHAEPQTSANLQRLPLCRYLNLVERFFGKLKQFRAVVTRYDKRDDNLLTSVQLASIRIWLRHDQSAT